MRGIASDFSWERQQQRILWGTWRREGRRVIVQRGSYTTTYTIENDHTLISDRGRPWMKISPHSGKRFQGTYARADYRDASAPRLVLRADGSYEDRGDIMRMIGSGWNLVVPDGGVMLSRWSEAEARRAMAGGSGTYTYENFTLTLRDRDGRMWQTSAYVPPGETLPGPARLVVNGRALVKGVAGRGRLNALRLRAGPAKRVMECRTPPMRFGSNTLYPHHPLERLPRIQNRRTTSTDRRREAVIGGTIPALEKLAGTSVHHLEFTDCQLGLELVPE
ncbi:MAG: hypothetical protein HND59_10580 [Pseudomonadota bacterium]|nr:MAG: hypothetical protein HND59_10580 [Pseudomonadota bacterium]